MNKKEAIRELSQNLEKYFVIGFCFHLMFIAELKKLLEKATGNEKEIFSLLIKQLDFIKVLGKEVYKADSNEIIKYQERNYYSLHLSAKNFNFRLLMTFDDENNPIFLAAFYERSGKRVSDYSLWSKVIHCRYIEMIEGGNI